MTDSPDLPDLSEIYKLDDFEDLARAAMEPAAFDYYAGGSWDGVTLAQNPAAFRQRQLLPRVLVDVSKIDTSTEILGRPVAVPFGFAPAALHGLAHPGGEVVSAAVAGHAGMLFCPSTMSSRSLEDVAAASSGPRWFQLYVQKDRGLTAELVSRAESAGYEALILTVDLPVGGYREGELRHRLQIPPNGLGNFRHVPDGDQFGQLINLAFDQSLTWNDLSWVQSLSGMPLVVKGIMTAQDTVSAVEHGANAVWISNHGGRQLDRVPATIEVLEEVVDAVDRRTEVYLDGGVRRGLDVVIALALGADAVFLARPFLFALAAGGEAGLDRAIEILRVELEAAMALLGAPRISAIARACVL